MLNEVLDKRETAQYLRMSVSNIDRLIHNKQIPHSKVGKKVLFLREDLIRWLKNKRVVGPEGEKKEPTIEGWLGHKE
jgi:excisionase family DNA binding protein